MLVLPQQITHTDAGACSAMLRAALKQAEGDVVVDASPLARFDSSALAVLLDCRRDALTRSRRFSVSGMPPRLAALASLYGVAPLLGGAAPAGASLD
jgi:phospholipid transport system transporter-binding protein